MKAIATAHREIKTHRHTDTHRVITMVILTLIQRHSDTHS